MKTTIDDNEKAELDSIGKNFVSGTSVVMFECHITVDPILGDRIDDYTRLEFICNLNRFKIAKLYMTKTGQVNDKDSFMTGHGDNYQELLVRMYKLIGDLLLAGYKIRRYKIEQILLDSRVNDIYNLIRV